MYSWIKEELPQMFPSFVNLIPGSLLINPSENHYNTYISVQNLMKIDPEK